jgi:hypothetical protein
MKSPVVSLPSDRRVERTRALQGAVTRFQTWQRSFQWAAVLPARRWPQRQQAPRVRQRN